MRKWLGTYALTLVGLIVTLVLQVIGSFAIHLPTSSQYILIAVGLLITLVIATIEHEVPALFRSELDTRLKIYRLLLQIEDKDYLEWAHEVIADCEEQLAQLAHGEYRSRMGEKRDRERLHQAKTQLRAVYLGKVFQELRLDHTWVGSREARYYRENLDALKRGVKVSRIFILLRSKTVDESQMTISDVDIVNEMVKQTAHGIAVKVAWVERLKELAETDVFKDFVILDDFEVDERDFIRDDVYEVVIWRNHAKIRQFRKIYTLLDDNSALLQIAFAGYPKAQEYVHASLAKMCQEGGGETS